MKEFYKERFSTTEEIAVSIAAELIKVKRKRII
jgi:xanthine/CO dehydrogenase XdhC/CoxF family maturation factor